MLGLAARVGANRLRRVLAIGCHPDDIEIGCGGTLLRLTRAHPVLEVTWVVLAADGPTRRRGPRERGWVPRGATSSDGRLHDFRDGFLHTPAKPSRTVRELEADRTRPRPDAHGSRSPPGSSPARELTWNTFRDHLILEYEIPKYDGDLGTPNVFVPLTPDLVDEKLRLLGEHYASQPRSTGSTTSSSGASCASADWSPRRATPRRSPAGTGACSRNELSSYRDGGCWVIEPERHEDDRGFFASTWGPSEFEKRSLTDRRRPDEHLVQPQAGHAPRSALSGLAPRGSQARALYRGHDLRRRGRPPPGVARRFHAGSASSSRPRTGSLCTCPRDAHTGSSR